MPANMSSHRAATSDEEAGGATRAVRTCGADEPAWRISGCAARRMLVLAVVALCAQPGAAAGGAGLAHGGRGSGAGDAPRARMGQLSHQRSSPASPSSSPAPSPYPSSRDLQRTELSRDTGLRRAAVAAAAARESRRGTRTPPRMAGGLRRTVSYNSDLSAAQQSAARTSGGRKTEPTTRRRTDDEYRAAGDPNSLVFTRLQTGLYPHLNLS